MHALEPGHGKSAIAAYAVGYNSNKRHILVLGISTAIAHTASIFILAFILGTMVTSVAGETVHKWIETISGTLLLMTGAFLLVRAIRKNREADCCESKHSSCSCGPESVSANDKPISFALVSVLGISGGLIPCPTALAVLLSAMTTGQLSHGMWTVCLFSVGISITLCSVALVASFASKSQRRLPFGLSRWSKFAPIISSVVILAVGLLMLVQSLLHP